eukprot:5662484-Prorocentrum_lima.AAC.1
MQRQAHKPKNKHLKSIHCALRYCKRVKTGMYFKKFTAPGRVVVIADAAYKINEDKTDYLALR